MAPTFVPPSVSLLESLVGLGGAVELKMREMVLTGVGISSGSPNQTGEQSRGGWFEDELTSDANHGDLIVLLLIRLHVQSQHEHVNR